MSLADKRKQRIARRGFDPYHHASMQRDLGVTGIPEADHLNNTDPLALLLSMLLDQQMR